MEFIFLLFVPFLFAFFLTIIQKLFKQVHLGWVVFPIPLLLFSLYITFLPSIAEGQTFLSTVNWIPSLKITLTAYLDGLSLLFSLLITGIGALVVLYSIFYLNKTKERLHLFYFYLLLFMTAMLGVVQSDNIISLYLFWELTSISSFLLIGYWYNRPQSTNGALKSMMITVFGGVLMLGAFALLYAMTGTYSIREIIEATPTIVDHPYFLLALLLLLFGAFTKSAQFPFYIWLPDAMAAPTPVSAYLHSATMVKAGLYLVARFTPVFSYSEYWIWIVSVVGIFTMIWASFFASKQTDLKAILAFSTVSQLGLMMFLFGASGFSFHVEDGENSIFRFAAFAALFHMFNHSLFKGSLFMIAGIVDHETGTRDIRKLGGLMSIMPISFTIAFIGSFSMAGIPPFGGFLSKELFLTTVLSIQQFSTFSFSNYFYVFLVIAWLGSIFTFIYSMYFLFHTFGRKKKIDSVQLKVHEAPISMLLAPAILAAFVVIVFFIPNVFGKYLIQPAVLSIQPLNFSSSNPVHVQFWHGWTPELLLTIGVIVVGFVLFKTFSTWNKVYSFSPKWLSLNTLYDFMMHILSNGTNKIATFYMTGSIRSYMHYMFYGFVIFTLATVYKMDVLKISFENTSSIGLMEIILVVLIIVATIMVVVAKSRLSSILALGAVGYTVALFFVLFKAPDLALTQLVIETVSVALFLLTFYHLPKMNRHENRLPFRLKNAVVAISVGTTVTIVALAAQSNKLVESITYFYKETVYEQAGGKNMVNVILVDYRGFDTLFEITVLAIAAIGIIAMIQLRLSKGGK